MEACLAAPGEDVKKKSGGSRLLHIEFMRVIAICLVIYNHTGHSGFLYFLHLDSRPLQWLCLIPSVLCTVAVPLFFMMSGALLLGKTESLWDIFRKRVLKYGLILLAFSLFYWLYANRGAEEPQSFRQFLVTVYSSCTAGQLWYLYSYLAVMLMLPLLRAMARGMTGENYGYLALMSLVFAGILPMAEYVVFQGRVTLNSHAVGALFTATNIVFFMMGYYMEQVMPPKRICGKTVLWGAAASLVCVLATIWLIFYQGRVAGGLSDEVSQEFMRCLIAVPAYTLYAGGKWFFETISIPEKLGKAISFMGGTTFGIFLLEPYLSLKTWFVFDLLEPWLGTIPACIVRVLCTLLVGSLVVAVLKKIPLVRKLF